MIDIYVYLHIFDMGNLFDSDCIYIYIYIYIVCEIQKSAQCHIDRAKCIS